MPMAAQHPTVAQTREKFDWLSSWSSARYRAIIAGLGVGLDKTEQGGFGIVDGHDIGLGSTRAPASNSPLSGEPLAEVPPIGATRGDGSHFRLRWRQLLSFSCRQL